MPGTKYDEYKLRMDLIPTSAIYSLAEVFTYGSKKYGDYEWKKGIYHSRLYAATLRHLISYWDGENIDSESGLNHLKHAMANLAMMIDSPLFDDRRSII